MDGENSLGPIQMKSHISMPPELEVLDEMPEDTLLDEVRVCNGSFVLPSR